MVPACHILTEKQHICQGEKNNNISGGLYTFHFFESGWLSCLYNYLCHLCYTWSKGEALPSPSAQNHLRFLGRLRFLILGFFVLSFSRMMRIFSTTVRVVRIIPSTNAISATFFPSFLYFNYTSFIYSRQVNSWAFFIISPIKKSLFTLNRIGCDLLYFSFSGGNARCSSARFLF